MRLVVKVESAGKKVCDLEGGGLAAAGKSLGTADPTSEQTLWSLWLLPALTSEGGIRRGSGFVFLGFVPARGCSPEITAGYCCLVSIRDARRNETCINQHNGDIINYSQHLLNGNVRKEG